MDFSRTVVDFSHCVRDILYPSLIAMLQEIVAVALMDVDGIGTWSHPLVSPPAKPTPHRSTRPNLE